MVVVGMRLIRSRPSFENEFVVAIAAVDERDADTFQFELDLKQEVRSGLQPELDSVFVAVDYDPIYYLPIDRVDPLSNPDHPPNDTIETFSVGRGY